MRCAAQLRGALNESALSGVGGHAAYTSWWIGPAVMYVNWGSVRTLKLSLVCSLGGHALVGLVVILRLTPNGGVEIVEVLVALEGGDRHV